MVEKKRGIAERKMLLLASDIKRGKAIWKNRENKVKDDEGTMRRRMIVRLVDIESTGE